MVNVKSTVDEYAAMSIILDRPVGFLLDNTPYVVVVKRPIPYRIYTPLVALAFTKEVTAATIDKMTIIVMNAKEDIQSVLDDCELELDEKMAREIATDILNFMIISHKKDGPKYALVNLLKDVEKDIAAMIV